MWNLRCPCKIVWYNVAICVACLIVIGMLLIIIYPSLASLVHPVPPSGQTFCLWLALQQRQPLLCQHLWQLLPSPGFRMTCSLAACIWKCLYMSRCPMSTNIQSVFIHPVSVASFRFTTESRIDLRAFTFFFRFCFFTLAMQASPTAGTSRK